MIVNWSLESISDITFIRYFIERDNLTIVPKIVAAILRVVQERLSAHPQSGRPGRVPGTFELVIPKLRFIVPYRIRNNQIQIIRVYHSSRRWPESF